MASSMSNECMDAQCPEGARKVPELSVAGGCGAGTEEPSADRLMTPTQTFDFGLEHPVNIVFDAEAKRYTSGDPRAEAASLFQIRFSNGFMPTHLPLEELPPAFDALAEILARMPAHLRAETYAGPGDLVCGSAHGLLWVADRPEWPPEAEAEHAELVRTHRALRRQLKDASPEEAATIEASLTELAATRRALCHAHMNVDAQLALYRGDGVDAALPLGRAVADLPNLADHVAELLASHPVDSRLLMALFRDYSILLNAFIFEPCHWHYQLNYGLPNIIGGKHENVYGLARAEVPPQIAHPLHLLAEALGNLPYQEYQQSWGLNNWRFLHRRITPENAATYTHPDGSLDYARLVADGFFAYDNLDIIRPTVGSESERGFAVIHVQLEAHTGRLVEAARCIMDACTAGEPDAAARSALHSALWDHADAMRCICEIQHEMWQRSKPTDYMDLRTFIYGVEGNTGPGKMFPEQGLAYQMAHGVVHHKPRGESGANSSIIPAADTLFSVTAFYPPNKLTKYLSELRKYRPLLQRDYLRLVADTVSRFQIAECRALETEDGQEASIVGGVLASDPVAKFLWLLNLSLIRRFRMEHWHHTQAYIIRNTRHPVATGGTPITSWLPNQIGAVLRLMQVIIGSFTEPDHDAIDAHFAPRLEQLRTFFEGRPVLPEAVVSAIETAPSAFALVQSAFEGTVEFCRASLTQDAASLRSLFENQ